MKTRLLVGIGGLSVLLPAIIYGGPLAVQVVVFVALAICVYEYASMAFPDDRQVAMAWLGTGTYLGAILSVGADHLLVPFFALWIPATLIFVTLRPGEDISKAADIAGRHFLGLAWLSLLPMLMRLRDLPHGLTWIFLVLGISWLGDTGAYFAGRSFGKRKLYERISPKKTVEGVIGGVIVATIGVFVITSIGLPEASMIDCLVLGVFGCLAGVLGDLSESMMKRAFGVKDAGTIMPGHGGLLDRIDSVLFVGAVVYGYAIFAMA